MSAKRTSAARARSTNRATAGTSASAAASTAPAGRRLERLKCHDSFPGQLKRRLTRDNDLHAWSSSEDYLHDRRGSEDVLEVVNDQENHPPRSPSDDGGRRIHAGSDGGANRLGDRVRDFLGVRHGPQLREVDWPSGKASTKAAPAAMASDVLPCILQSPTSVTSSRSTPDLITEVREILNHVQRAVLGAMAVFDVAAVAVFGGGNRSLPRPDTTRW